MNEFFLVSLSNLCNQFCARRMAGPPLAEHEEVLYRNAAEVLAAWARAMAVEMNGRLDDKEDE